MTFETIQLDFHDTQSFDRLIVDYLSDSPDLQDFYAFDDTLEGIRRRIETYSNHRLNRQNLKNIVENQYSLARIRELPAKVAENINLLIEPSTFTVTTGHQLNLFSGPLYIFYKLISTINLAETLSTKIKGCRFVPVYWMATEDHDIDEISQVNLFGNTYQWNSSWKGPAGKMPLDGLEEVFSEIEKKFGSARNGDALKQLFHDTYLTSSSLAEATRKWVHSLFGEYGLIILDGNDAIFKRQFEDIIADELRNQTSSDLIANTASRMKEKYFAQVNPRAINLFFLGEDYRSRIIKEGNTFAVLDTNLTFNESELLNTLHESPECFSPNVVLRPLYQESILPDVACIGGPAEIAYWLELKSLFEYHNVPMPVLFLRSCAMIIDDSSSGKLEKLALPIQDIFHSSDELIKKFLSTFPDQPPFDDVINEISAAYHQLEKSIESIDPTLIHALEAEVKKTNSSIESLRAKTIRSMKRKNETGISQVKNLKDKLFPDGKLQERVDTMIPYFLKWGDEFIPQLIKILDPLQKKFLILVENKNN